jgi:hypothetical protein
MRFFTACGVTIMVLWIGVSVMTNTFFIVFKKIKVQIHSGSFQNLGLWVTPLATILNTRTLEYGILAVDDWPYTLTS